MKTLLNKMILVTLTTITMNAHAGFTVEPASSEPKQDSNLIGARYQEQTGQIQIALHNKCQKVTIKNSHACSRSYPGQTSLYIVESQLEQGDICNRSAMVFVTFPVAELNCRPAIVTIYDDNGGSAQVEVITKNLPPGDAR